MLFQFFLALVMLEQLCDPYQFTFHMTIYGLHPIFMEKLQHQAHTMPTKGENTLRGTIH